ncbi:hypothetical protein Cob_v012148 [Colletotrichum orbiculare MAFF 240422]|uniref:Uncharacterized protein n=1 Tax=Colletotrichum orbiculare (strain 104-T / ATCC 96160 / CBS 514.97 / LARS 414 / MAFF 240422) TaxID=1213857 RepID=A0A484F9A0_COLOR|nr:hypothetical protein Cob_v012148 [Colletotrichum orbiculare MAFF 240422]
MDLTPGSVSEKALSERLHTLLWGDDEAIVGPGANGAPYSKGRGHFCSGLQRALQARCHQPKCLQLQDKRKNKQKQVL